MPFSAPQDEIIRAGGFTAPQDEIIPVGLTPDGIAKASNVAAAKVEDVLNPPVNVPQDTSMPSTWERVLRASKEAVLAPIAPFIPSLREKMISPQVGQYGPSRLLQEEGERVNRAADAAIENAPQSKFSQKFPRVGAAATLAAEGARAGFPQGITPRGAAESLGGDMAGTFAGKTAKPVLKAVGKGVSKVGELASGVPAETINRVVENPRFILPEFLGGPKAAKAAGKALGQAEKNAGFVVENLDPETGLSAKGAKEFVGKDNPFISNQSKAQAYYDRVAEGQELTPQEMLDAYKSSADYLKTVSRKDRRYVKMLKFQNAMQDTLKSLSSEYAKATKDFAEAATRRATTNLLPRTQTGKISQGRVGFNSLITGGGLLAGGLPGAATAFVASSPLTYGLAAAGVGTTGNLIEAIAKSPPAMKFLQGYANSLFREKMQGGGEEKKFSEIIKKSKMGNKKGDGLFTKLISPDATAQAALPADKQAYATAFNATQRNDWGVAKDAAKKAFQLNPKNIEARRLLERIAQKEGRDRDFYTGRK